MKGSKSKVRKTFDLKPQKPKKPKDDPTVKLNGGSKSSDIVEMLRVKK